MKTGLRALTALLVTAGVADLVMVPFMMGTAHSANAVPPAGIALGGLIGAATLASVPGILRGRRWGFVLAMVCRALDLVQAALGITGGVGAGFVIMGVVFVALSVPALVLLVRLDPRRALRRAPSAS
jgi:hypothetical protein